jgi:hypothetical protein
MKAQVSNPKNLGGGDKWFMIWGQPHQKQETLSETKLKQKVLGARFK